jgi:hypothetical protein
LALLAAAAVALAAGEKASKPAVLFAASHSGGCGHEVAGRLAKAGFALRRRHAGLSDRPLSWDEAKRYNAIVLFGLGRANADMTLGRTKRTIEALNRHLAGGGGVLMLGAYGQMATDGPPQTAFLTPLGLTPLFDELPLDAETSAEATAWKILFAHTKAIADSPVTKGVTSLWYPAPKGRPGAQNHAVPFVADARWQVVVRGSPSSRTRRGLMVAGGRLTGAGTFDKDVPLVAFRQVGRGRIVFLGITQEYLTGPHATTTLESVVLDRGLTGAPSGGYRLLENALRWLTAPSAASGEMGGATMDATMLADPHETRFAKPFSWDRKLAFPAVEPAHTGAVGARTKYSTGKATADEWVAAAKAGRLAWLVFLEDFRHLTAAEFDKLKADCARLSGPAFTAVPGIAIDDEVGNHYFYFGTTFPCPAAKFLSADGKVFRSHDPSLGRESPYIPGQLAMTTLDYAYSISSFKLTAGNYLFGRDAAPFADFFSNWDAMGVVTSRAGRLVEDATADYLKIVDSGQGPLPLAIDLMDDPSQLSSSRWRTVLRLPAAGGQLIGARLELGTKVADYFNAWHHYPDNPTKLYITSGPQIKSWCYVGPRDYEGNLRGDFVWQNYRWRLRGAVSSAVGLKEVVVLDGTEPFRRFLPGGAKRFEFTIDLTHDKQHNLVLIATDTRGGRAVSGEQWDRNHRLEEFMCGDRNNQLSYGYVTNSRGTGLLLGGNQTLATPNKRLAPGISPAGTFKNDGLLGAPAFDGAAGGEPDVWENVEPISPAYPASKPTVCEARRLLHTGDLHVGEGRREHRFADGVEVHNVWHTLWRTEPATDYVVTRRNTFYQIDPDSPLAVFRWRIDVKLLRDLPNKGFHLVSMPARATRLWAIRDARGPVRYGAWEPTRLSNDRTLSIDFGRGACAAYLDSPLGGAAIFPLTDGLTASMRLPRHSSLRVNLPASLSPRKAGQSRRVELLILGIPRTTKQTQHLPGASNEIVERFYRDFGLDGGPTGYEVAPAAGLVVDRRYILRIDGAKQRCFSGRLTGKLVSSLPIAVEGLRDNWSSFLYDRALKKARPIGTFESTAWATVPLRGRLDVFVGQPVTADSADVTIQLTQTGEDAWHLEVHNPTDRPIETTVRKNALFDPLNARAFDEWKVTVPPGSSVHRGL